MEHESKVLDNKQGQAVSIDGASKERPQVRSRASWMPLCGRRRASVSKRYRVDNIQSEMCLSCSGVLMWLSRAEFKEMCCLDCGMVYRWSGHDWKDKNGLIVKLRAIPFIRLPEGFLATGDGELL